MSRSPVVFASSVLLGCALPLVLSVARGDVRALTISASEIKDGMKGYGLTVFKGTTPERFDVEAIGVMKNFRPGQDLILVKTPHPRLNITKNVKGMSGSPIYFDGRLAGAYAYSLSSFQTEPVAGVTPIAPMLSELHRPIPPGFFPLESGRLPLPGAAPREKHAENETLYRGTPGSYDLFEHARSLGPKKDASSTLPIKVATPLLLAGVGDRAAAFAQKLFEPVGLEPLQTGGGSGIAKDAPLHYVDGGAIGVQLTRGDVSMMGMGTVTHVEGTKLCGFGHPMMNAGASALPTAIGNVMWIYASDQHSFKVGEAVRPLGALVQDRQSAIVADETVTAPMFPMKVEVLGVESAPKKSWNVEVADEKFMAPSLVATVLGSVVEATVSERRDVTWRFHSKLVIAGQPPMEFDDFGVAIGGTPEAGDWAQSRLVRTMGDALNNPWQSVRVEKVEGTISVKYTRDLLRLRGVELLDDQIAPGDKARILVHLRPFSGKDVTRTLEVTLPKELAGKEVELEILPGYEVFPEVAAPESLRALLQNSVRQSLPPESLVVQFRTPGQGVTFSGHTTEELPTFALDMLRPVHGTVVPEPFQTVSRQVFPIGSYVEGRDRVRVKVRSGAK